MMEPSCIQSDQEASISGELTKHQRKHKEELFSKSGEDKTDNMTPSRRKLSDCTHCGKAFKKSALQRHKLLHVGEKKFTCILCKKAFYTSNEFNRHTFSYTGEFSFACPQCGKSFSQASNLKTHKLLHTGEKLFACKQCDKSFSQPGYLKTHKPFHKG